MFQIEEELKKLPASPGVYIMHGEKDEIIYVGKAVSLKNRVRQYFQSSRNKGAKIEQMVTHITRFEYIVTDSELEALVLECNLIKEHRPKYNTMLKDDKSYPFIKVTVNETYPRVLFSRRMKKDKARYFGPYTSASAVKDVIELVRKLYKVRSCSRVLPRDCGKDRPCLYYHMKQCMAPCQGKISQEEYRKNINEVLRFLNGDFEQTIEELTDKMMAASEEMRFEDAMEYRDLISSIRKIGERQKITSYGEEDKDIIAAAMDESMDLRDQDAVVQVFFVRAGKLIGREHYYLHVARGDTKAQVLSSFLKQFYAGTPFIPREIIIQKEIEDASLIEEWLSSRKKQKVYIRVPKKGTKEKLVELAEENAKMVLSKDRERIRREEGRTIGAVHEVENWLGLTGLNRMEAYDISNINGFESVGSMVVYEKGKPKPSDYRKFKLKWVQGPNDYASMEEVLTRRFTHEGKDEFDSFSIMPDLILM
ncbi:MAG: excinuclease ABC subunit UvrC, partial [Blautia sp.]|nr:excinuclease ABC subunit UvrC [Blautia sp.]